MLTAEDFSRLPDPEDGSKLELERSVVVALPVPGFRHGSCLVNVACLIEANIRNERLGRVVFGAGLVTQSDPDTVRAPDLTYWSHVRIPPGQEPEGYATVAPDLIVEVLSPDEGSRTVATKLHEYFTLGTRLVWVADPLSRTVTVYQQPRDGRVLGEDAELSGGDVLSGFRCKVADFFA